MAIYIVIIYLLVGSVIGILAGLLGLGGGILIIPILDYIFELQGFDENFIMRSAFATSLSCILLTSIASIRAHNKLKNILWPVVLAISPGVLIGALFGGFIASYAPIKTLKIIFSCFVFIVIMNFFLDFKAKPGRNLPKTFVLIIFGVVVGTLTSLTGLGGGALVIPFLTWCNIDMRKAAGTSAGMALPIALFGVSSYIYYGFKTDIQLPEYTLGYVYLPATILIACASILAVPIGAKLTFKIKNSILKKIFASLLLFGFTKMFISIF